MRHFLSLIIGHFLFLILHLAALLFGAIGLIITIPLHLIYGAVSSSRRSGDPNRRSGEPDAPRPDTHRRCPECRELVRADASRCKHCGIGLLPQPGPLTKDQRMHGDAGGFVRAVRDTTITERAP